MGLSTSIDPIMRNSFDLPQLGSVPMTTEHLLVALGLAFLLFRLARTSSSRLPSQPPMLKKSVRIERFDSRDELARLTLALLRRTLPRAEH